MYAPSTGVTSAIASRKKRIWNQPLVVMSAFWRTSAAEPIAQRDVAGRRGKKRDRQADEGQIEHGWRSSQLHHANAAATALLNPTMGRANSRSAIAQSVRSATRSGADL